VRKNFQAKIHNTTTWNLLRFKPIDVIEVLLVFEARQKGIAALASAPRLTKNMPRKS
jgi:hypothetical protein